MGTALGAHHDGARTRVHYQNAKGLVGLAALAALESLVVGFAAAIAGAQVGSYVWAAGGILVLAILVLPFLVAFRPLTLTGESLRIRRGFKVANISVADIAGVGLVYRASALGSRDTPRWLLMVWRGDGSGERTPMQYLPFLFSSAKARRGFDPVAGTDPAVLAATAAGRAAAGIFAQVLARQGASGPLATRELQKHVPAGRKYDQEGPITAFWSPDGVIGYAGSGSDSGRGQGR